MANDDSSDSDMYVDLNQSGENLTQKNSNENNEDDLNLFEDLIISKETEKEIQKEKEVKEKIKEAQDEVKILREMCNNLKEDNTTLIFNISSLWKTAVTQSREKDRKIAKLEKRNEATLFRRSLRWIPKDELDRIVSRIAAYHKEDFSDFLKALRSAQSNEKTKGAINPHTPRVKFKKGSHVRQSVIGWRTSEKTNEAAAQLRRLVLQDPSIHSSNVPKRANFQKNKKKNWAKKTGISRPSSQREKTQIQQNEKNSDTYTDERETAASISAAITMPERREITTRDEIQREKRRIEDRLTQAKGDYIGERTEKQYENEQRLLINNLNERTERQSEEEQGLVRNNLNKKTVSLQNAFQRLLRNNFNKRTERQPEEEQGLVRNILNKRTERQSEEEQGLVRDNFNKNGHQEDNENEMDTIVPSLSEVEELKTIVEADTQESAPTKTRPPSRRQTAKDTFDDFIPAGRKPTPYIFDMKPSWKIPKKKESDVHHPKHSKSTTSKGEENIKGPPQHPLKRSHETKTHREQPSSTNPKNLECRNREVRSHSSHSSGRNSRSISPPISYPRSKSPKEVRCSRRISSPSSCTRSKSPKEERCSRRISPPTSYTRSKSPKEERYNRRRQLQIHKRNIYTSPMKSRGRKYYTFTSPIRRRIGFTNRSPIRRASMGHRSLKTTSRRLHSPSKRTKERGGRYEEKPGDRYRQKGKGHGERREREQRRKSEERGRVFKEKREGLAEDSHHRTKQRESLRKEQVRSLHSPQRREKDIEKKDVKQKDKKENKGEKQTDKSENEMLRDIIVNENQIKKDKTENESTKLRKQIENEKHKDTLGSELEEGEILSDEDSMTYEPTKSPETNYRLRENTELDNNDVLPAKPSSPERENAAILNPNSQDVPVSVCDKKQSNSHSFQSSFYSFVDKFQEKNSSKKDNSVEEDTLEGYIMKTKQNSPESIVLHSEDSEASLLQYISAGNRSPDKNGSSIAVSPPPFVFPFFSYNPSSLTSRRSGSVPKEAAISSASLPFAFPKSPLKSLDVGRLVRSDQQALSKIPSTMNSQTEKSQHASPSAVPETEMVAHSMQNTKEPVSPICPSDMEGKYCLSKLQQDSLANFRALETPSKLSTSSCSPIPLSTPLDAVGDITATTTPPPFSSTLKFSTPVIALDLDRETEFSRRSVPVAMQRVASERAAREGEIRATGDNGRHPLAGEPLETGQHTYSDDNEDYDDLVLRLEVEEIYPEENQRVTSELAQEPKEECVSKINPVFSANHIGDDAEHNEQKNTTVLNEKDQPVTKKRVPFFTISTQVNKEDNQSFSDHYKSFGFASSFYQNLDKFEENWPNRTKYIHSRLEPAPADPMNELSKSSLPSSSSTCSSSSSDSSSSNSSSSSCCSTCSGTDSQSTRTDLPSKGSQTPQKTSETPFKGGRSESTTPFKEGRNNSSTPFKEGGSNSSTPFKEGRSNSSTPFKEGKSESITPFKEGRSNSGTPFKEGKSESTTPFKERNGSTPLQTSFTNSLPIKSPNPKSNFESMPICLVSDASSSGDIRVCNVASSTSKSPKDVAGERRTPTSGSSSKRRRIQPIPVREQTRSSSNVFVSELVGFCDSQIAPSVCPVETLESEGTLSSMGSTSVSHTSSQSDVRRTPKSSIIQLKSKDDSNLSSSLSNLCPTTNSTTPVTHKSPINSGLSPSQAMSESTMMRLFGVIDSDSEEANLDTASQQNKEINKESNMKLLHPSSSPRKREDSLMSKSFTRSPSMAVDRLKEGTSVSSKSTPIAMEHISKEVKQAKTPYNVEESRHATAIVISKESTQTTMTDALKERPFQSFNRKSPTDESTSSPNAPESGIRNVKVVMPNSIVMTDGLKKCPFQSFNRSSPTDKSTSSPNTPESRGRSVKVVMPNSVVIRRGKRFRASLSPSTVSNTFSIVHRDEQAAEEKTSTRRISLPSAELMRSWDSHGEGTKTQNVQGTSKKRKRDKDSEDQRAKPGEENSPPSAEDVSSTHTPTFNPKQVFRKVVKRKSVQLTASGVNLISNLKILKT